MTAAECPICHNLAEPTKEHVWPKWFLKRMDRAGAPPTGWAVNGVPVLDRYYNQIHGRLRQRVFLDICEHCNSEMDRLIEKPAKEPVNALALNGWRGSLDADEWRAVGLWWAKVLLLTGFQGATLEHPKLREAVNLTFDEPMPDVRWLSDGSGVPSDVSVFVHNADLTLAGTEHELLIPAQVHSEGKPKAHCHVLSMATPGLCVTVVSHPGISIRHPVVELGQAWELLHAPPAQGDVGDLEPLSARHVTYSRGGGVADGHVVDGSEYKYMITLFGYEREQVPTDDIHSSWEPGGAGP